MGTFHLAATTAVLGVVSTGAASAAPSPALWYVTRAAAVAAYVLLALAVALGLFRSLAHELSVRVGWALDELHQFISLLAGAFVLLHLVTLALDPYIHFSLVNLLLPFGQPYRPLPTDLGVLGLYALAVVLLSSWLRRRITYRLWRGLHYAGFLTFFLVTLHGLLAGADAAQPWMHGIYIGSAAAVVFLVLVRVLAPARDTDPASARAHPSEF